MVGSTNSAFRDISIYSAGGFAMFQTDGGNNTFMCGPNHASCIH